MKRIHPHLRKLILGMALLTVAVAGYAFVDLITSDACRNPHAFFFGERIGCSLSGYFFFFRSTIDTLLLILFITLMGMIPVALVTSPWIYSYVQSWRKKSAKKTA